MLLKRVNYGFAKINKYVTKRNTKELIDKLKGIEKEKIDEEVIFSRLKEEKEKLKEDIRPMMIRLSPGHLPLTTLAKAKTVFSKYKPADIREKGFLYMKIYAFIHAVEKPSNLSHIKLPFQNTEDLSYEIGELKYALGERKDKTKDKGTTVEEETEGINKGIRERKDMNVALINYDQNTVVAYLARKYPESYQISKRLLNETSLKFPNFKPNSFLDFGAGLSPASIAFKEQYPDCNSLYTVEPNLFMKNLGIYMTEKVDKVHWAESLYELTAFHNKDRFSIVNCSFVLEEIPSAEDRLTIVQALWEKVEKNGFIYFVLPGSPMGYRFLNDLRNLFRNKSRDEANIIAPCPHHETCPIAKESDSWCRFEQSWYRLPKNVLPKHTAELDLIESRFCYLIVRKGEITISDEKEAEGIRSISYHRIIKPMKKRGGHSIISLCNSKGKLEERNTSRSHGLKYGYLASKQLKWGDQWKYPLRIPNKYRKDSRKGKRLW